MTKQKQQKKDVTYSTRKVAQLVRWEGNPRPPATDAQRADLKASLLHKGVLMPLVIRPTGTAGIDEVVAGDTRRLCIAELEAEGLLVGIDIPVIVRDDLVGNDAAALDVAISENIHVPMHPMDQYAAFMQLIEMGRGVLDIANAYGVSQRVVEQRLSFAKLDERARDMVKENARDMDWASAMTMASAKEQKTMIDEIDVDPRRYMNAHDVRRRMEEQLVPTSLALFDVASVSASLVRKDLFDADGASYMTIAEFIPLQDAAVEEKVEEAKAEGWSKVSAVSERNFDRFRYMDGIEDPARGEVIFVRHQNGGVTEHRGLALRPEERINAIGKEDESVGDALFGESSEVVRAIINNDPTVAEGRRTVRYLEVSRAVIAQAILMEDPKLTMAMTVAGMLSSGVPKILEGRLFTDRSEMDPDNSAIKTIDRRMDACRQIMEAGGIDPSLEHSELVNRLCALDEGSLMTLMQVEIAKRITTDMPRVEKLFDTVTGIDGVSLSNHWRPDRTYLSTLSKPSLEALAAKILPARIAGKLTGGKPDYVETIAQVVDDAYEGGMRLQNAEKDRLTSWAPTMLGGSPEAFASEIVVDDENDGEAMFGKAA